MILLDLSRLISRAGRETPTGIDRVELAYAEHLIGRGAPSYFTMLTASGRFGLLPRAAAEEYVLVLAECWRRGHASLRAVRRSRRLARIIALHALLNGQGALRARLSTKSGRPVYLLVSHHHLEKRRALARLMWQTRASFVCLIHDLIPIEFPEYALPGQDEKHRRRVETAAALADAVIVNSEVTRQAFEPYLARAGRLPPVLVAPFGVDLPIPAAKDRPALPGRPYFVCVGTIEARKNHLLLLNVWRHLAAALGDAAPALVLAGQRGWETESAVDMLERCPALRGLVFEHGNLPDAAVNGLMRGARALLLPSFAEGFGFPVIEALAQGIPVICSDLAALRENGRDVPEYLDPLDGVGWGAAIIAYCREGSPRRAAQLRRLAGWQPPSWQSHFAEVEALIANAAASDREPGGQPTARLRDTPALSG